MVKYLYHRRGGERQRMKCSRKCFSFFLPSFSFFLSFFLSFFQFLFLLMLSWQHLVFFLIFIYLFIWLCRVLVVAGSLLSCGMWTLSCGMHVGSSSLTRDRAWAPCIVSVESYPLCHQGSPGSVFHNLSYIIQYIYAVGIVIIITPFHRWGN